MADIKICDRCGERIDGKVFNFIKRNYYANLVGFINARTSVCSYDLCQKCSEGLLKFMRNEIEIA